MTKETILLVEDDGILAMYLEDTLTRQGYTPLRPVPTGEEAIRAAVALKPDLILMDIELAGEMNGITAAEKIGTQFDTPIVFLTGFSQDPLLQQAKITAPYGYLVKPVPERELAATIEMALYKYKLDRQVKESEARYRSLIEQASDGVFMFDQQGNYTSVNTAGCVMLGYSPEEFKKLNIQDLVITDDPLELESRIQTMLDGSTLRTEQLFRRKDGSIFPVEISARMLADGSLQGIVRDITERKQSELLIKQEKELLDNILSSISDAFYSMDENLVITYFNAAAEKILNKRKADVIGVYVFDVFPEGRGIIFETGYRKVLKEKSSYQFETFFEIAPYRNWYDVRIYPQESGISVYVQITTEQKEAHEALLRSLERFDLAAQSARLGVWDWDILKNDLVWDDMMYSLYGVRKENFAGAYEAWLSGLHPDDVASGNEMSEQARNGERDYDTEFRSLWPDGSIHYIKAHGNVIRDAAGNAVRMTGVNYDITAQKQAEIELRRSEQKFSTAFLISPDSININRLQDGLYIDINQGFSTLTGYSREEVVGKTSMEINIWVNPDDRRRLVRGLLEHGEVKNLEAPFRIKNGEILTCLMSASLIEVNGEMCILSMTRDITARKTAEDALRESENFTRSIIDALSANLCVLDENGIILSVNKAWLDFAAYNSETPRNVLPGTNYLAICDRAEGPDADEAPIFAGAIRSVLRGEQNEFSMVYPCHSPTEQRWFQGRVTRFQSGDSVRALVVHENFTAPKLAEAKIQQLNTELEQRVHDRTAQLETANQELEAFSYSVSHDLRAPLRAMEGFSTILLEDYNGRLDEQGLHYLNQILESSERMKTLINDLLSLSKVSRTEISRQRVDLSAMVRKLALELLSQYPQRQVDFEICPDLVVEGDSHLLKIAMENLVNNAFKFTGNREKGLIQLGVTDVAGERVYFVRDNGTGFNMAYADKLFAPFQRLHRANEFPGTGIGLVTVQRIIKRHGGRIWPEAEVDRGATFYFTLTSTC